MGTDMVDFFDEGAPSLSVVGSAHIGHGGKTVQ